MKKSKKNSMPHKSSHAPHDLFFKDIFSQKKFAIELLSLIFSPEEQKLFQFNTLKEEKTIFKSQKADLIFSLKLNTSTEDHHLKQPPLTGKKKSTKKTQVLQEATHLMHHKHPSSKSNIPKAPQKAFIFLILEHKSQKDEAVLVQILRYQTLLYSHFLEHTGYIVPIIPIIFYHGKEVWGQKLIFFQNMFQKNVFPKKFESFFRKNVLNFPARILNLQAFDTSRFKTLKNLKSGLAFFLMKKIWDFKWPEDGKEMLSWAKNLNSGDKNQLLLLGSEYIKDVCGVSQKELEILELEALQTGILRKGGNMGLLEYVKQKKINEIKQAAIQEGLKEGRQEGRQEGMQEGMQQGMQQGMQKVALNMLQSKTDIDFICKITGLRKHEVNKLKKETST